MEGRPNGEGEGPPLRLGLGLVVVVLAGAACGLLVNFLGAPAAPEGPSAEELMDVGPVRRTVSRGAALYRRLAGSLQRKAGERGLVLKLLDFLTGGAQAPPPSAPAPAKGATRAPPKKLPSSSKEPPAEQAARLWQAGVLATKQGDYAWAIRQFEECLEAVPGNDGCVSGLAEARRRLGWNRRRKGVK